MCLCFSGFGHVEWSVVLGCYKSILIWKLSGGFLLEWSNYQHN